MPSVSRTFLGAAMLAMVRSQGVILKAVGDSGTSTGLLGMHDVTIPRLNLSSFLPAHTDIG